MKKFIPALLISLLVFFPMFAKADVAAPDPYKTATISNTDGAELFSIDLEKIGHLEYGQEVTVMYEITVNEIQYVGVATETGGGVVKLSDITYINKPEPISEPEPEPNPEPKPEEPNSPATEKRDSKDILIACCLVVGGIAIGASGTTLILNKKKN